MPSFSCLPSCPFVPSLSHSLLSKGLMPLDMVHDVVAFAKELVSVVGEEGRKWVWSEWHESLLHSEGK